MTRKGALAELIAKVEAGTVCRSNRKAKWQDCDFEKRGYGYQVNANIAGAYNGSLDAAKALRIAVIPSPVPETINSDARIELLRILRALHAQEQGE